jgi:hypothetical protein
MSADLAVLTADPGVIERAADPGEFVIQACDRAKTWLREALEHGEIEQIAECKSQAEAIRVYTMSKQLGKDAELAATEIVRRAERGIGVAIRRGQEAGEIARRGAIGSVPFAGQGIHGSTSRTTRGEHLLRPRDAAGVKSASMLQPLYDMADGVSDGEFEAALSQARAEGNLTRANVMRKVRQPSPGEWIPAPRDTSEAAALRRREIIRDMAGQGYSSRQMSERIGTRDDVIRQIARGLSIQIPADEAIGRTHHINSNRIVRETVHALEGLAMGIQLVDPGDLDPAQAGDWAASLTDSIRTLNRLIKTMREVAQ